MTRARLVCLTLLLFPGLGCGLFVPGADAGEGEGEGEADPLSLTVTVAGRGAEVPADYPVLLRFDHAAMVAAGADQLGLDLALVDVEARVGFALEPDSGFNTNVTGLWFRTPSAIAADGALTLNLRVDVEPSPRIDLPFEGFEDFADAQLDTSAFQTSSCEAPSGGAIACELDGSGGAVVLQSRGPQLPGKAIGFLMRVERMADDLVISEAHHNAGGGASSRYWALRLSRDDEDQLQFGFRKHEGTYDEVDVQPYALDSLVRVELSVDSVTRQSRLRVEDREIEASIPTADGHGEGDALGAFQTGLKDTDGAARIVFLHMYERVAVAPEPSVLVR